MHTTYIPLLLDSYDHLVLVLTHHIGLCLQAEGRKGSFPLSSLSNSEVRQSSGEGSTFVTKTSGAHKSVPAIMACATAQEDRPERGVQYF